MEKSSESQLHIRNFCIIAHIDHGKSTFADRLLELTQTVEKRQMKEQLLDQMELERERGITIKLQPVKMQYMFQGKTYVLNLIDTPGHVDFHYEVSRSLAAVEGALLLVDATKGVQAQTLANLYLAIEQGLEVVPVINKIDLPNAEAEKVKQEIMHVLGCREEDILLASGKTGVGVQAVLERIITVLPAPEGGVDLPLRALIFDSVYDTYKGVVAFVKVVDGSVERDESLYFLATGAESTTVEVGYFRPKLSPSSVLSAGDIGYVATGLKTIAECRVGDTITLKESRRGLPTVAALPGYHEIKPAVYASLYPTNGEDYGLMRDALEKLKLNDAAFVFEPESNQALGRGFRCGFLGLLHLEIIQARLEREFDLMPTITTPSVVYQLQLAGHPERLNLYAPTDMPDPAGIEAVYEPFVALSIITPSTYLGSVMELAQSIRSVYQNTEYIDAERVLLTFEAPLMDVIVNFHDDLKSASSGYASMNYEAIGYRESDVVRLDILVANERIEAFSRMVPQRLAQSEGRKTVEKLKQILPRQNFVVALQAAIGAKVIARETLSAFRKDVTGYMYGGDFSRKKKLLEKQKAGKKRMQVTGRVNIPAKAFLEILRNQ